jgi:hypothetical protein
MHPRRGVASDPDGLLVPRNNVPRVVPFAVVSFVIPTREQGRPEDPETLFRGLRPRDPTVRDLLLRQGDVLRQDAGLPNDEPDVAVELPTGGGETLVGLLIAEWRRRALGNRVAYLCPTVQLVNRVASKAR